MIFYFSGTGNTRYAATHIAEATGERLHFIPHVTEVNDIKFEHDNESLGFMFPVYSWGVPMIVTDFIKSLSDNFKQEANHRYIWLVATCGDECGMAAEMFRAQLESVGLHLDTAVDVIMPNVYVLLPGFDVDSKKVETEKLDNALMHFKTIASDITARRKVWSVTHGPWPKLKTRLIFPLFRRWGINPRKWRWNKECVRCGKCAAACPVGNISMKGGNPFWGENCTSCLACYHTCPVHAVEYGSVTRHKGQYYCHRK